MLNILPKVIHQIWLGTSKIPERLQTFKSTWIINHPDWAYEEWNDEKSQALINENFKDLSEIYKNLPFLTQKVDVIKYLILYHVGGLYVDYDCECLKPTDILQTNLVNIGLEPRNDTLHKGFPFYLGSAFMSSVPRSEYFKFVIDMCVMKINTYKNQNKYDLVMETTGPTLLNRAYIEYEKKGEITLIEPSIIGPFRQREATLYRENKHLKYGSEKLSNTYVIHHFYGSWL